MDTKWKNQQPIDHLEMYYNKDTYSDSLGITYHL